MQVINIRGLRKYYNVPSGKQGLLGLFNRWKKMEALKGISFSVEKGEFVGLIGANGSGKTTLVKILSGVLVADAGEAKVLGEIPWKRKAEYLRRIGVLFGNRSNLVFDIKVIDSYLLMKDIYGLSDSLFDQRVKFFGKMLGLDELYEVPVRKLSLGQRMRAEIGCIFLHKPKVVFLDEPTIGLDAVVKESVQDFLLSINRREGVTIIMTTHNLSEIELMCKRSIVLKEGSIVWDGPTKELKRKFENTVDIEAVTLSQKDSKAALKLGKKYGLRLNGHVVAGKVQKTREIDALNMLMKAYELKSLSVREPELEEIVKKIYKGNR
ncbi:MAG: ATP-binding cassette domain-containing protein [Candidatus Anstonellales archaeon]